MPRQPYPSDLTDGQWRRLWPWLPAPKTPGRPHTVSLREVVNAIRHVLRTGCTWRSLPLDFPCWQTVYGYFSRSVKMTEVAGPRDYDARKPKKVALVAAMHKLPPCTSC